MHLTTLPDCKFAQPYLTSSRGRRPLGVPHFEFPVDELLDGGDDLLRGRGGVAHGRGEGDGDQAGRPVHPHHVL